MEFRFKEFTLQHGNSAMKIGFDAVVLGSWLEMNQATQVADIGAGCGVIGFMLSQKNKKIQLTSIEMDKEAADECTKNGENLPWNLNHVVIHSDWKTFSNQTMSKFDLLVSNPPYFPVNNQIVQSDRETARHQINLTLPDLFAGAEKVSMLHTQFAIIFPWEDQTNLEFIATTYGWHLQQRIAIITKEGKKPKRGIWLFGRTKSEYVHEDFIIHKNNGEKSEEYLSMVSPFLL